jgi:hypothetical protein
MNDLGLVSVLPPLNIIALLIMMVSFSLTLRRMRMPIVLLHFAFLIVMLYGITTLIEVEPRFDILYRHAGYTEYIMRTGTVDPYLDAYFDWPGFFIWSAFLTRAAGYHDILGYSVWSPVVLNLLYLGPMYMIFRAVTTNKRLILLGLWLFCLTNWVGQDYYSPQGLGFFMYLVIIAILLKWFKVPAFVQPSIKKQRNWFKLPPFVRSFLNWFKLPPFIQSFLSWFRMPSFVRSFVRKQQEKRREPRSGILSRFSSGFSTWLKAPDMLSTPARPGQRLALLMSLLVIFAFVVFSHPLTPFFVLASVTALVVFRRCAPLWLPIVMALMMGAWILGMTQPFLVGHLDWVMGGLGHFTSIFTSNVTEHVVGNAQHLFITRIRVVMTLFIWGLACLGALWRLWRGYRDITIVLLALAPFPLFVIQPYGGEMLLRVYLFTLPPMVFFVAALFSTAPNKELKTTSQWVTIRTSPWRAVRLSPWGTVVIAAMCVMLLSGFLFTRYGNESMDYKTEGEVAGVHYLYSIATPNSLFLEGSDGTPWQLQDFEKYDTRPLTDDFMAAVTSANAKTIVQFTNSEIEARKYSNAYLIVTQSQKVAARAVYGLPYNTLDRLDSALLASGRFKLIYRMPDAEILLFIRQETKGGSR